MVDCPRYDKDNSAVPSSNRILQDINKVRFALLTVMEAKGKVVPGLASRKGHRAYINSLAVDHRQEIVADDVVVDDNDDETEDNEGEGAKSEKKAQKTTGRWLHPDTRDALRFRWDEKKGSNNEEE